MPRALVVGDLHLSGNNLLDTSRACMDIVTETKNTPYDLVVFCGDINDNFGIMHLPCIRVMSHMIRDILCDTIVLLVGNHDRPNNKHFLTNEHPFHALLKDPRVRVADTAVLDLTVAGRRLAFAPYVPDGRLDEAFKVSGLDPDDSSWVAGFSHQMWKGCLGNDLADGQGDIWPSTRFHMFSGHIHGFNEFQANLTIVGACIQHHASDSQDRAILDLDLNTLGYRRIRLDSVSRKHSFHATPDNLLDQIELTCNTTDSYVIDVYGEREAIRAAITLPAVRKLLQSRAITIRPHAIPTGTSTVPEASPKLDFLYEVETNLPAHLRDLHLQVLDSVASHA